ncbi:phosphoglycolate phosphatase/pyrophosphatase PpaX [Salirhabdus euzebyi]|uniref:Phosphoglycolate phosphatase/pyrophosphatase PpaX n=1 Tax=Salirhabdus euzebyi TaxID=394506 RepID=A0A841Q420_9BACI|nr:HAD family hydrolase [Salirhabdus euzebyi]MBB6453137.1 phosphoglycolate phosphatase/pyrophosphatase PpaX [Salirhabdus euzebyi]
MIKSVIFDFDGTLANTLPICYEAFQKVFAKYDNKTLTTEDIHAMFGPSEVGIIRKNLIHQNVEEAIELYYETYLKKHNSLVNRNKEIENMLRTLTDMGVKLGIVTGKARRSLDISLHALHMDHYFHVTITGDDVVHPKPHPEGVEKALSLLEVNSNEAVFVGDSDADIKAGLHANVHTVGVEWLPNYEPVAITTKPHAIFTSPNELIDLV